MLFQAFDTEQLFTNRFDYPRARSTMRDRERGGRE
jgi:hypothetical protein